jgi:nucleotide-binding universal stress UspA family protein
METEAVFERGSDGHGVMRSVIVVGIDGSEAAWRAAAYAAGLARRQGSGLALVYVQTTNALAAAVGLGPSVAETAARTAEQIEREVRQGAEGIERAGGSIQISWEFHTFPGDVFNGLSNLAVDLRADAIVVGACHGLCHRFLGSPSLRLVKAGRCPVIVVP